MVGNGRRNWNPLLRNVACVSAAEGSGDGGRNVRICGAIIACASTLYFLSVMLATLLDDQWRTWGTMIGSAALWWLSTHTPLPASMDIFRAMGEGSPVVAHTMPWLAMAFSLVLAAICFSQRSKLCSAANTKMAWISSEDRRRYWQSLPLSALAWMALTSFLTFASVGLATNLVDGLQWPFWWVLAKTACFGAITALSFATILRKPKARFLILIPMLVLLVVIVPNIQLGLPVNKVLTEPGLEYVRRRLAMGGMLSAAAAAMGYAIFVIFAGTQGVKHIRVRTELELAEKLQQTLLLHSQRATQRTKS